MTLETSTPTAMVATLRRYASRLDSGQPVRFGALALTLREASVMLDANPDSAYLAVHRLHDTNDLAKAVHMLHEQAHGLTPFRSCDQQPCSRLDLALSGPAPASL